MRKSSAWSPQEAAAIYWLTFWGLKRTDIIELAMSCEVLEGRSKPAIEGMEVEARKYISELKGVKPLIPAYKKSKATFKLASKLDPPKEIADLKPLDLTKVEFVFSKTHNQSTPRNTKPPIFEQVEANIRKDKPLVGIPPGSGIPLPNIIMGEKFIVDKEPTLEEILTIAKRAGATKVCYKDYVIKFV